MHILQYIYITLIGTLLGSFANVLIFRLPAGRSIISPRSACPACKHPIAWYDNIPVLSFIALRGRCRACHRHISWQYPCAELMGTFLAAAAAARFGWTATLCVALVCIPLSVAAAWIDARSFWLPDSITLALGLCGLLHTTAIAHRTLGDILWSLLPAACLWGLIWVVSKAMGQEAMGQGDLKLLAAFGLLHSAYTVWLILIWAACQGACVGLALRATGKRWPYQSLPDDDFVPAANALPFGPFLLLAFWQAWLVPQWFVHPFVSLWHIT